jgi:hypothetical protein
MLFVQKIMDKFRTDTFVDAGDRSILNKGIGEERLLCVCCLGEWLSGELLFS